ncbi:hypothetical protein BDF20DRAFT_915419 [Mycotypha africana]|uniref:uncharacterized protein n=1 Tax=Mycotypha africana TaxID=64632 RepID=UPI00230015A1|nr:uncharacterized protein BDF20DRAFT_915419 [Mycotypha africana]KAI8971638.1 hypothetical protein BDF20DRAFT_915419 [Mycotypha africana]
MTTEDSTVTAVEYVENQERLEKEAQDILPGKFEKCTFSLGYIRQPLYACKTCSVDNEDNKEPAGMCYSCSIACHSNHDLFELFPKRTFRCDCGLPGKFGDHPCSLMIPAKKIVKTNEKNAYNHNFQGRYCRCDQHYDPDTEEATMYQCLICEDWFHERCIGNIPEEIANFDCYVCRTCTKRCPFILSGKDSRFSYGLSKGQAPISKWIIPEAVEPVTEKVTSSNGLENSSVSVDKPNIDVNTQNKEKAAPSIPTTKSQDSETVTIEKKRKHNEDEEHLPFTTQTKLKKQKKHDTYCENIDQSLFAGYDNVELFLQDEWRQGLCKCKECAHAYKDNNVEFLLQEEETYEPEEDEDSKKSLLQIGMEQLQHVDRVQVIESLMAYKTLAADIKGYLESFKETGKVVTKKDIQDFFDAKRRDRQEQQ